MGTPNPEQLTPESVNNEGEPSGLNPKLMRELAERVLGSSTENSSVAPTQNTPNESE